MNEFVDIGGYIVNKANLIFLEGHIKGNTEYAKARLSNGTVIKGFRTYWIVGQELLGKAVAKKESEE